MTPGQNRLLERARDAALFILTLAIAFFAVTTLAQGQPVSIGSSGIGSGPMRRGNFLAPDQYATQGALNLYVDGSGTGNDGFTCTQPATPCSSIQGALNKIPFLVQHPVNVAVDGGSFAGFALVAHVFNAANTTTGAYIIIAGAPQGNFVESDAGTITGTFTSVGTDAVGFSTATDNTLTMTPNESAARFLALTTGTGAGQVLPIISNTVTQFTVSGTFSPAPVAGTGYAVTTPTTLINSAVTLLPADARSAASGTVGMSFQNLIGQRNGGYNVNVLDIGHDTGAFQLASIGPSAGSVALTRLRNAQATTFASVIDSSVGLLDKCASSNGGGVTLSGARPSFTTIQNSYLSTSASVISSSGNSGPHLVVTASELVDTGTTGAVIYASGSTGVQFYARSSRIRCTAPSANFGIQILGVPQPGPFATGIGWMSVGLAQSSIETCTSGLQVQGIGAALIDGINGASVFLSNTTGLIAKGGGRVIFNTSVPTFTTNTTDLSIDNNTFTRAAFVALVPNSVVDANYLSSIYLQP